jgi:hypothetical protein
VNVPSASSALEIHRLSTGQMRTPSATSGAPRRTGRPPSRVWLVAGEEDPWPEHNGHSELGHSRTARVGA